MAVAGVGLTVVLVSYTGARDQLARAGRGSYATYLLHPGVLVSVMLAFRAIVGRVV